MMPKRERPRSAPGLWSIGGCFNCGEDVFRLSNIQPPPDGCEFDCIFCGDLLVARLTPQQFEAIRGRG